MVFLTFEWDPQLLYGSNDLVTILSSWFFLPFLFATTRDYDNEFWSSFDLYRLNWFNQDRGQEMMVVRFSEYRQGEEGMKSGFTKSVTFWMRSPFQRLVKRKYIKSHH